MRNSTLVILIMLCTFNTYAQQKTIKGFVYDDYTNYRVKGVFVSPSLYIDTVYTGDNGKYKVVLPSKFRDVLTFTHPDYYPHIARVVAGDAMRLKSVRLIPKVYKLDTLCYIAFDENFWLKGLVKDRYTQKTIMNAEIRMENNQVVSFSKENGYFEVALPKTNLNLIINHAEYKTKVVEVKKNTRHDHYMEIWLDSSNPHMKDSANRKMNNLLVLMINELFTGSVGLNYERFVSFKHAVGFNMSSYLFGFGYLPLFNQGTARYVGLKAAPYYSFYFSRTMRRGAFVQGKIMAGYFDFEKLYYYYPSDSRYGEYRSEQFSSFGFGAGVGWYALLPKMKHGVFKIYIGYQLFPMYVPSTTESDRYGTLKVENNWWYINGPGSVVEIKFSMGGIF